MAGNPFLAAGLLRVLWLVLLAAPGVFAGSGQGTSGKKITVDTRTFLTAGISITFHRLNADALLNTGSDAGIDEPLSVLTTDPSVLARQPGLTAATFGGDRGLIADGVTPLLVKISASGSLAAEGETFELKVDSGLGFEGTFPIRMVDDLASRPKLTFKLYPTRGPRMR